MALPNLLEKYGVGTSTSTPAKASPSKGLPNLVAKYESPQLQAQKPAQKVTTKISVLPSSLGGGAYNNSTPGVLENTGHSNYADLPSKPGFQRNDIVPVSLGGVNSTTTNLEYEPADEAAYRDKVEKYVYDQYKSGKLALNAARTLVLNWKSQDIPGQPAWDKRFGGPQNPISNFLKSFPDELYKATGGAVENQIKAGQQQLDQAFINKSLSTAPQIDATGKLTYGKPSTLDKNINALSGTSGLAAIFSAPFAPALKLLTSITTPLAENNPVVNNPKVQAWASSPSGATAIKAVQVFNDALNVLGTAVGGIAGIKALSKGEIPPTVETPAVPQSIVPKVGETLTNPHIGNVEILKGEATNGVGYGLQKIEQAHPEVLPFLSEAMDNAKVVERLDKMTILEGETKGGTVRLLVDHQLGTPEGIVDKTFLNNAYFKKPVLRAGLEPAASPFSEERSTTELPKLPNNTPSTLKVNEGVNSAKEGVSAPRADMSGPFDGSVVQTPVYHGTKANFDTFEGGHKGVKVDTNGGFYFSPHEQVGKNFAGKEGRVIEAHLNIKNPKIAKDYMEIMRLKKADIETAKAEGYDGYYFKPSPEDIKSGRYSDINEEWVAFSPDQIKTITKLSPSIPKELEPLAAEARKYKTAEEFVNAVQKEPNKIPTSPEYEQYLKEKDAFVKRETEIYAEMRAMRDKYSSKTINEVPAKEIAKYENLQKELNETLSQKTLAKIPEGIIKTHIGEKGLQSQLAEFYNEVTGNKGVSVPEAIPKKEGDVTLQSTIVPGVDKFFEQDIKPAASAIKEGVVKTLDYLKKILVPAARGVDAQTTASIMRESLGRMAARKERVYEQLAESRKIFDRYTPEQSLDFIDNIERGKPNPGAEKFTAVMREALSTRWRTIQGIKGTEAYIENYFPHLWKDPAKATEVLSGFGKRPLEGTKSYLKQRTIPTVKQGVALGLEPESYNPVDLIMARVSDMDRFIMANDVWSKLKAQGLVKFVPTGKDIPTGYIKVDDKISSSFQFSPEEKGLILRGGWYMPEKAATIINNYLSPGLAGNPIYNAVRMLGNSLNQIQLGLSAFHAAFTSIDAVVSKTALEIQKVFAKESTLPERFAAGAKAITSPVAGPYYLWKNLTRGNTLLNDYFAQNPEVPAMVDALERAGGRVRMDSFYLNNSVDNFFKALRSGNYPGAALRGPGALIEATSKPLMQWLVPRQKLGVFADGATEILKQAEAGGWSEAKTTLHLQEFWDSVDNRLGQLVYDNLFWNKVLKDSGMLAVRSLGWNLGTFREIGGGVADYAKLPAKAVTGGEIRMTPKMAYIVALPYVTALLGAAVFYLYNGKAPETLLDYFYPRTGKIKSDGNPERITLPTYMKDIFAYRAEGTQALLNKVHPEISAIADMIQNQDYYGTEIRNPNDPLVKQLQDLFAYQAKQFVPFTITNYLARQSAGEGPVSAAQSFFGITPAPGYITKTPLQTEIGNLYDKRFGGGSQTKEQADIEHQKAAVRQLYVSGKTEEANAALDRLVQMGIVKDPSSFIREADIPADIKLFQRLPAEDQITLIKKMELYQLQRYAWYANSTVKSQLSSLSQNAKQFVQMEKSGEVSQPEWKRGQVIPSTSTEAPEGARSPQQ
jgi:hypothetical protein